MTETTASAGSVPVTTSNSVAPGHRTVEGAGGGDGRAGDGAFVDVLQAVGAVAPEPDGAAAVHRHPDPAAVAQPVGVPGTGSTSTASSRPARRSSCSAMRKALRRRWAPISTCWKSQPPQRPGPAWGQGASTRSGEGVRISTASARR